LSRRPRPPPECFAAKTLLDLEIYPTFIEALKKEKVNTFRFGVSDLGSAIGIEPGPTPLNR
jgi:hypothetical protein